MQEFTSFEKGLNYFLKHFNALLTISIVYNHILFFYVIYIWIKIKIEKNYLEYVLN